MEQIIDDVESYEGKKLHTYQVHFGQITKTQRQFLIEHFHDYSWESGLAIARCWVSEMPKIGLFKKFSNPTMDVEFKFESIKPFKDKDQQDWNEKDLENILDTRLIGKEQFFSNMLYNEESFEGCEVSFIDQNGTAYDVRIDKYSAIMKR